MNANNSNYITESDESKPPQPKAEHTPGQWYTQFVKGKGLYIKAEGELRIAQIPTLREYGHRQSTDCDQESANARLISQAPAMLEALESLFDNCAMVHKHWGEGDNSKEADAAIQSARAVIAKAKGE